MDRIENEKELMELLNNDEEEESTEDTDKDGDFPRNKSSPFQSTTMSQQDLSLPIEENVVSFRLMSIDEEENLTHPPPQEMIVQRSPFSSPTNRFDNLQETPNQDASMPFIAVAQETVQPLPDEVPLSSTNTGPIMTNTSPVDAMSKAEKESTAVFIPLSSEPPLSIEIETTISPSFDPFAAPSTLEQLTSPPRTFGSKSRMKEKWETVLDQSKVIERTRVELKKQETISQFSIAKDGTVKERADYFIKKLSTSANSSPVISSSMRKRSVSTSSPGLSSRFSISADDSPHLPTLIDHHQEEKDDRDEDDNHPDYSDNNENNNNNDDDGDAREDKNVDH